MENTLKEFNLLNFMINFLHFLFKNRFLFLYRIPFIFSPNSNNKNKLMFSQKVNFFQKKIVLGPDLTDNFGSPLNIAVLFRNFHTYFTILHICCYIFTKLSQILCLIITHNIIKHNYDMPFFLME